MTTPQIADHVRLDAGLLKRLLDLASDVGENLYKVVRRTLARGKDEAAVTLFVLAINAMFGRMLMAFPDIEGVAPQINALWRILGIPFRIEITRVQ